MTLDSTRTAALRMKQELLLEAAKRACSETDLVAMRAQLTEVFSLGHALYSLNLAAEEETRAEAIRRLEGSNA